MDVEMRESSLMGGSKETEDYYQKMKELENELEIL